MRNKESKSIIYIVSDINKSLAFEWIVDRFCQHTSYNLTFILLNSTKTELEEFLISKRVPNYRIYFRTKKDIIRAIYKTYKLLKFYRPDVIHCHLLYANLVGLLAGKLANITKRIYTRHHSTYHHIYHPKAVLYDKLANYLCTHVIAISQNVEEVLLKEGINVSKIRVIHHGFRLSDFEDVDENRVKKIKEKYNIPQQAYPIIGVVARYIQWKGIQYIIPAFSKILADHPNAFLVLANAQGPYELSIKNYLSKLPASSYVEIKFEEDIPALYHLLNLYIHTPINRSIEAFGQTYVEALAAGVPSVFTLSGVACEFIHGNTNALVVDYCDSEDIERKINFLLRNEMIAKGLSERGKRDVNQIFYLNKMIKGLQYLYEEA